MTTRETNKQRNPAGSIATAIKAVMGTSIFALSVGLTQQVSAAVVEFSDLKAIIEINASDGDVGFHALGDAGAWTYYRITDPNGDVLVSMRARNGLAEQGITEEFFESSEPLCEPDDEEPDARIVTLAEFLARFPEGEYTFFAKALNGDRTRGSSQFSYNIPAAPDISMTEDMTLPIDEALIIWAPGDDLGEACHDQSLVDDGTIADPAEVPVAFWEVVVEPDDDDAPDLKFVAQLPAEETMVTVPEDFLQPLVDMGFTEFKFEIGAIEESLNATFSEGTFEIED